MMDKQNRALTLYKRLLALYPDEFKEQVSESMLQTFRDLYQERLTEGKGPGFVLWIFVETAVGVVREHVLFITSGAAMKNILALSRSTALVSSVLLAVAFIVAPFIYLVGNLRDAMGAFAYDLADFLYGPVWAVSLVSMVFILRERIGERAPRRMSLAFLAAVLAAAVMVMVACIRSANRHYHMLHPELHLENSSDVLIVWTTLIAGLSGAGWHFLGWAFLLIGSVGWTARCLPSVLSILYLVVGISSLFVYLLPIAEGSAVFFGVIVSIWQGVLLWRGEPKETPASEQNNSQPDRV